MITLSNDFHRTEVRVRPTHKYGPQGRISTDAWRRAMRKLCSVSGCFCGGIRGPQAWDGDVELQEQADGSRRVVRAS